MPKFTVVDLTRKKDKIKEILSQVSPGRFGALGKNTDGVCMKEQDMQVLRFK